RHFAAWLGLVPRECSTAGRQRLGGISRAGDERLRQLLVLGATAVIQHANPRVKPAGERPTGRPATSQWLPNLLSRKPRKLAAVGRDTQAGHTTATAPHRKFFFPTPLHQGGRPHTPYGRRCRI